jgi:hypothetical protein
MKENASMTARVVRISSILSCWLYDVDIESPSKEPDRSGPGAGEIHGDLLVESAA